MVTGKVGLVNLRTPFCSTKKHKLILYVPHSILFTNIWRRHLTTSKKRIGSVKLGFLFVFLIIVDSTTLPDTSNSILGDVTDDNWYFFMFRTPQHSTCYRYIAKLQKMIHNIVNFKKYFFVISLKSAVGGYSPEFSTLRRKCVTLSLAISATANISTGETHL